MQETSESLRQLRVVAVLTCTHKPVHILSNVLNVYVQQPKLQYIPEKLLISSCITNIQLHCHSVQ